MSKRNGRRLNLLGKITFGLIIPLALFFVFAIFIWPHIESLFNNKEDVSKTEPAGVVQEDSQDGPSKETELSSSQDNQQNVPSQDVSAEKVSVRGCFNTFGGYTSAIVANGGLTTTAGSYYDQSGLDVNLWIEDEDDVIVQNFINGDIDFFFMTVNKMPIVCKQFIDNGVYAIIPYFSDTSTGGDGIVVKDGYDSIISLQDARIAMARNSVSTAIPLWFFNNTDLDEETIQHIANNFLMYDSTQEAVDAFINGEADAVSTWDITTALSAENSHLLFSTKEGENLVIDAMVVNKEFAESHPEAVSALINGCISVVNDVNSGKNVTEAYNTIRASVPDYADYDDETLASVLADSRWLGYKKNMEVTEIAPPIYRDFAKIWEQLGNDTASEYIDSLFDFSYLEGLSSNWSNEASYDSSTTVSSQDIDFETKQSLISTTAFITFEPDSYEFEKANLEFNYSEMDRFIEVAKALNTMIVSLEGNVSIDHGAKSSQFSYTLSEKRAEAVKQYMVEHGIEESRIVTFGNGGDDPHFEFVDTSDPNFAKNRNVMMSIYSGHGE